MSLALINSYVKVASQYAMFPGEVLGNVQRELVDLKGSSELDSGRLTKKLVHLALTLQDLRN